MMSKVLDPLGGVKTMPKFVCHAVLARVFKEFFFKQYIFDRRVKMKEKIERVTSEIEALLAKEDITDFVIAAMHGI